MFCHCLCLSGHLDSQIILPSIYRLNKEQRERGFKTPSCVSGARQPLATPSHHVSYRKTIDPPLLSKALACNEEPIWGCDVLFLFSSRRRHKALARRTGCLFAAQFAAAAPQSCSGMRQVGKKEKSLAHLATPSLLPARC